MARALKALGTEQQKNIHNKLGRSTMLVQVRRYPAYNSLWNEIADFESEIDRVFGSVLGSATAAGTKPDRHYSPSISVVENDNDALLIAELPGVKKEDLKISVENNVLTFSGTRKGNALPEKATWLRNEIRTGDFSRSVQLPEGIDASKISAELTNGQLLVTLPKAEEVKPREIRIN